MSSAWVVIIGASSDLGIATIREIEARSDWRVFAHYRRKSTALAKLEQTLGSRFRGFQADLSSTEEVAALLAELLKLDAPAAFLHLAAPALKLQRLKEMSRSDAETALAVQVLSAFQLLQGILPSMAKAKNSGAVILMLSEVVLGNPPKGLTGYVIGKYAQLGLLKALKAEFAASGLRFFGPAPGMMETKFLKEMPELAIGAARKAVPGGKLATPEAEAKKLADVILNTAERHYSGDSLG